MRDFRRENRQRSRGVTEDRTVARVCLGENVRVCESTLVRERLRENVQERTFATERSGENVREGMFVRERSRGNVREGTFARGDLQGHCRFGSELSVDTLSGTKINELCPDRHISHNILEDYCGSSNT